MRISAFLPAVLGRRLAGRETLQRSVDNAFWLALEQVIRMGLGLVTGVWVARYLGPEQYGWLSYAAAVTGTVTSLTSLGLNAVVVRELARDPVAGRVWLGAAFFLKSAGAAIGFLVCLLIAAMQHFGGGALSALIVIVAMGMFFQVFDLVDLVFQAEGAARLSGWIRLAACIVSNLVKVALLLTHASIFWLAAVGVLELALSAAGWVWTLRRRGFQWKDLAGKTKYVSRLLAESWPLALSGLAIYAQAYGDQLVIGRLLGGAELGQYAAAMRLVVAFGFLPMVVYTVAAPEITRAQRDSPELYRQRLFNLYRVMSLLFAGTTVLLLAAGTMAARWLLGAAYVEAAALLPWLAFRLLFTNFGVARGVFLTNEGLFRFGLLTALAGATVNVVLNVWWVPLYGARGAIGASLVSFALTTFAFEALHPRARFNLGLMLQALFLPWRSAPR
jgi:O-antigen/teichoic acid export membrane protein